MYGRGEIGAKTPVELHETRAFDWVTEFYIPLAQAGAVALSLGIALIISPVIAIKSAGQAAFWVVAGGWSFATFWWYWRRSYNLVTGDGEPIVNEYEEGVSTSLSWLEVVAGLFMSILAGFVALCFHKVLQQIDPAKPEWLTGWVALLGIAQFPVMLVLSAALLLSFGQELAQRSPFQEQFIWKALGTILEGLGNKAVQEWWREPVLIRYRDSNGARDVEIKERPAMTDDEKEAAIIEEFITRGEQGRGFAREAWIGESGATLKTTGGKLSRTKYESITKKLIDANLLEDRGRAGKHLLCSAEEAIKYVVG